MTALIENETKPRCVVADDVRAIREKFATWLSELGLAVIHASCGATALNAIRSERPRLVVTDIDMPHTSGLHLLQSVRRDSDSVVSAVPVIIASSLEDSEAARLIERLDGSVYLKKPVDKNRFVNSVAAVMEGSLVTSDQSTNEHQFSSRFRRIIRQLHESQDL
ncbi:response regulator [Planctomycetes bacterium K23_9]|uniref:Regulator of RpoS n=1 Tax=Stieleria marina TaxID=1930275 RepID=A0A517NXS4_9BACT|nr:Regulator of RpoS [Planctomycetes bacterium K23_9]